MTQGPVACRPDTLPAGPGYLEPERAGYLLVQSTAVWVFWIVGLDRRRRPENELH